MLFEEVTGMKSAMVYWFVVVCLVFYTSPAGSFGKDRALLELEPRKNR